MIRSLNRNLNRCLTRYGTRMFPGVPRPNHFREALRLIGQYVRWRERKAKEDPEFWGPNALQIQLRKLDDAKFHAECDAVIERIYSMPGEELDQLYPLRNAKPV